MLIMESDRAAGRGARHGRWGGPRYCRRLSDGEFNSATFDTDEIDDSELEAVIVEELDDREPDWRSHLRLVD